MFAYCGNNPVNYIDKGGQMADSIAAEAGEAIAEFLYELITGRTHPNKQTREKDNQVIVTMNKMIVNTGKTIGKACVRACDLYKAQTMQYDALMYNGYEYAIENPYEFIPLVFSGAEVSNAAVAFALTPSLGAARTFIVTGFLIYAAIRCIVSDYEG